MGIFIPGTDVDDPDFQKKLKDMSSVMKDFQSGEAAPRAEMGFVERLNKSGLLDPGGPVRGLGTIAARTLSGPAAPLMNTSAMSGMADFQGQLLDRRRAVDERSTFRGQRLADLFTPDVENDNPIVAMTKTILGGPIAEGHPIAQLGEFTKEESQADAERQLEDAKRAETALKEQQELRRQSLDVAADMLPGGRTQWTQAETMAQVGESKARLAAEKATQEAAEAVTDPTKQRTQSVWLNAARKAVGGAGHLLTRLPMGVGQMWDLAQSGGAEQGAIQEWSISFDKMIDGILPTDDAREKEMFTKLAAASGSIVGYMVLMIGGGALGPAMGFTARGAQWTASAIVGGTEGYQEAETVYATGLSKLASFAFHAGLGLTELIPIMAMLGKAEGYTGGAVSKYLARTAVSSLEEAIQEVSTMVAGDAWAEWWHQINKDMSLQKYAETALISGIAGAVGGTIGSAVVDSAESARQDFRPTPEQEQALSNLTRLVERRDTEAAAQVPQPPGTAPVAMREAPDALVEGLGEQIDALPGMDMADAEIEAAEAMSDVFTNERQVTIATPGKTLKETPGGLIPMDPDGKLRITHDSPRLLDEIDPFMRGTGPYKGVERARLGTPPSQPTALEQRRLDVLATIEKRADKMEDLKAPERRAAYVAGAEAAARGEQTPPETFGEAADAYTKGVTDTEAAMQRRKPPAIPGREERDPNVVDRSYFGVTDELFVRKPGEMFKDTDPYNNEEAGNIRHTVAVDPDTLYNWYEDPLDLRSKLTAATPTEQQTELERLIRDAGFKGVYFSASNIGQFVMMFEKTTPETVVDKYYRIPPLEIAKPADFAAPTPETFRDKGGWAIITATKESIEGGAKAKENIEANTRLRNELRSRGIKFKEVGGVYKGVDQGKSLLIFTPERIARELGAKYGQESVLTRAGLEYTDGTGRLTPAVHEENVVGEAAQQNEFYSTLPDGTAFSVGLDFDATTNVEDDVDFIEAMGEPIAEDEEGDDDIFAMVAKKPKRTKIEKLMDEVPGLKGTIGGLTLAEQDMLTKTGAKSLVNTFTKLPDPKEMAAVAFSGRAKRGWYKRSAKALLDIFGMEDAPRFAALLAALSPQVSVESNSVNALRVWTAWIRAGRPTEHAVIMRILGENVQGDKGEESVLGAWENNSLEALTRPDPQEVDLSGPKVSSFMMNLRDVVNEVTNDAWIANYAAVDQKLFAGIGRKAIHKGDFRTKLLKRKSPGYLAMNAVVRRAAEVATRMTGETWTPAEIQETVWSWAKTLYEKADNAVNAEALLKMGGLTAEEISATPDFATLFATGVYRSILEAGGYNVEQIAESSGRPDAGDAGGREPLSAEGYGLAQEAFERHLRRAARRLDAVRVRREQAKADKTQQQEGRKRTGRVKDPNARPEDTIEDTFFPDEDIVRPPAPIESLMDADDMLAQRHAPVRGEPLPMFPERSDQSFDRWFAGSQVVDEAGAPKAVFHGTPTKGGFRVFDPNKSGKTSVLFSVLDTHRQGFFFAENEEFAKGFAAQRREGTVIPVFLSIKNAFDARESTKAAVTEFDDIWDRMVELDPSLSNKNFIRDRIGHDSFWEMLDTAEGGDVFVQAMRDLGYDGVHMVEPNHDTGEPEDVWVAFDNTQIKSAIENTGAYSPTDPDIHAARGRPMLKGEQQRPAGGIPGQTTEADVDLSSVKLGRALKKLMAVTARQGRLTIKGADVLGQYIKSSGVIRLRSVGDFPSLVHEAGHSLHMASGLPLKAFETKHEKALMAVATDLYGGDVNKLSKSQHIAEGFAEMFRAYVTHRSYLDNKWPQLGPDMDALLKKEAPTMFQGLQLLQLQYDRMKQQIPSTQAVRNLVVPGVEEKGLRAVVKDLKERGVATWWQEKVSRSLEVAVNRWVPLNSVVADLLNLAQKNKGAALDLKVSEDPRKMMVLAANSPALAMVEAREGIYPRGSMQSSTRSIRDMEAISQGVDPRASNFETDPKVAADFDAYLVALRAIDEYRRFDAGKIEREPLNPQDVSRDDLVQAVRDYEAQYPQFVEAGEIAHEINMAMWKKAFDAGLMDQETYDDGLDRLFYVPLLRDMSDKRSEIGPSALSSGQSLVKHFAGSDRLVVSPTAMMIQKLFALEHAIARNDVKLLLAQLADRAGQGAGAIVEQVPATTLIGQQLSVKEAARALTKDAQLSSADAQDLMTMLDASMKDGDIIKFFRAQQISTSGENIVFYWDKGKIKAMQLVDGEAGQSVAELLDGIGHENMPFATALIAGASQLMRFGIIHWPDYIVMNFARDQFQTWILSDVGFTPFVSGIRGVYDELTQSDLAKQYNASMAMMGGAQTAALHEARVDHDIKVLNAKGYRAQVFSEGLLKGLAKATEVTETGTRMGLWRNAYLRAKADGLSDYDAGMEAAYIATDIMNFGMNGSRTAWQRRTIPFLNSQIIGLYKLMRTLGGDEVRQRKGLRFVLGAYFKNEQNLPLSRTEKAAVKTGRRAWVKMASLALLSAAVHFAFEDDEDYQEAGEYLRATGWVIPMGDGRIFYYPKPFELALLANFVERALEHGNGDDAAKGRFVRGLGLTLIPPLAPPGVTLLYELQANRDLFTGREITDKDMQGLSPHLRYNHYTSELAKQIGKLGIPGLSPVVTEHVLQSLGASMYRDVATVLNTLDPDRAPMDMTDAPLTRRVIRDVRRGSAASKDFWNRASAVNGSFVQAANSYEMLIENGQVNMAEKELAKMDDDRRAYALLIAHFKPEAERLHPFYRVRDLNAVVNAIQREMVSDLPVEDSSVKDFPGEIVLNATLKGELDEALSELSRREIRNALVTLKVPGWSGKKLMDTEHTREIIRELSPDLADELDRRLKKKKVYSDEVVQEYWPEVKERLLSDGQDAYLDDLSSMAKTLSQ